MAAGLTASQVLSIRNELVSLLDQFRQDSNGLGGCLLHGVDEQAYQAALDRIDSGDYGFCVGCGETIELNRLKANPLELRCLSCISNHHIELTQPV